MRLPRFASAFRRRLRVEQFTPTALAAMARNPSYRAPAAADLHDEEAAQPPRADAPLEEWGAKDLVIRDGKVVGCSLSGRAFLAATMLNLHEVRLVAVQPFLDELAQCPRLSLLRRLDLSGNRIGVAGAQALAASPHLGGLRELGLSGNDLGEEGLDAILGAHWFDNLEVLELAENNLLARRASKGQGEPSLARRAGILDLDLSNNPLGPDVELPLGLRRLALSRCDLGAAGVAKLAGSGCFELLDELDLSFNALGPPAACGFARKRLNLAFNDIEDAGLETLESHHSLEWLDLSGNRISAIGATEIADSFPSLQELNLTANPIGDAGAVALLRSESLGNLRRLNLANCGLTDAGAQSLAASGTLGGLQSLSLAWNAIDDAGVRALASCPDLAGLRELDLTGTRLGFAAAVALAESQHFSRLRRVVLGENPRLPADAVRIIRERFGTISPDSRPPTPDS